MKQVFLFVASIFLIFSCNSNSKKEENKDKSRPVHASSSSLKIGFYVLDTIAETFEVYKQEMELFEKEGKQLQNELSSMQREYESVYTNYETGMRQQTLTPNQINQYEQRLGGLQQKIAAFQDSKMAAYQQKQIDATQAINNKIAKYSEEFATEHQIDLFLVAGTGSQVGYANKSMDMTEEFVRFMNEKEAVTKK